MKVQARTGDRVFDQYSHDSGIGIVHAKIIRDESNLPFTPFSRALIYFNPNSAKVWDLAVQQIKDLGWWLVRLADEVDRLDTDARAKEGTTEDVPVRSTPTGNVRSLDAVRDKRGNAERSVTVEPEPVDDREAALVERAAAALLELEKRFGTRVLYIAHDTFSTSKGEYMARVRRAVPEVVETTRRLMAMIGGKPKPMPTAKPFLPFKASDDPQ